MTRLCRELAAHGCDGLFVGGSTGELPLLDEDDRRALVAAASEGVDSKTVIYAGVSGCGIKQTRRYARNAAADGAQVAVVMAPFFLKLRQVELLHYFISIADASPIPIAIYHHPRAATALNPETAAKAAEHPNIVAIKDTSPDMQRVQAMLAATSHSKIALLQGNETLIRDSLSLGAAGMVSALANVAPEWHADLYRAAQAHKRGEADEMQDRITRLWTMFKLEPIGKSIAAFTYSLRLGLERRGWLQNKFGIVEGFEPTDVFRHSLTDHFIACGVPTAGSFGVRIDAGHAVQEESRDVA